MADKPDPIMLIKRVILRKPKANLEDVQRAWDRAGHPTKDRPDDAQKISTIRYQIKKKYGLSDITMLPIKTDGEPNISELMRLLFKKHPDMTDEQCRLWFSQDGLEYTGPLFASVKRGLEEANRGAIPSAPTDSTPVAKPKEATVSQSQPKSADVTSPDANQTSGPRARLLGKPGRKPNTPPAEGVLQSQDEPDKDYRSLEDDLDELIAKAREIEDSGLVERLREVRRYVIVKGVDLAEGRSES